MPAIPLWLWHQRIVLPIRGIQRIRREQLEDEECPSYIKGMRRVYLLELGLKLLDLVLAVKILNRLPSILLLSFKAWSNNCVNMLSFGFSWVSASVYKI